MRNFFYTTALILFANAPNAATVVIGFEEFDFAIEAPSSSTISTNGYDFYSQPGFVTFGGSDSETSLGYSPGSTTSMGNSAGNSFELVSFDISSLNPILDSDLITVEGFYEGGGSISTVVVADDTWSSIVLGSGWTGLSSVTFGGSLGLGLDVMALDNVTVTAVPVPAAFWLFLSALAGLSQLRKSSSL